ncbi:uncharacterized protein LOC123433241 isoform X1 [Hordeum vulgare subsp. vulgare]|uniref:uncharacterized protein LOC123433241 isoform X1 n=1 Tax=Hordeum vulgare subsp. vulgare TaxID=112509 RepID=UPI001D1A3F83|nr:uncharacterized protein LOC123433241 isoform X1 [Hordeum vulgare subsp. vulgare]
MAASVREASMRILRPAGEGLRRLIHAPQHSGSISVFGEGYRATQIQQSKEDLYNLIADAQANSAASQEDKMVLKTLCTHVKPRPHDPQWRRITTAKKVTKWTATSIVLATCAIAFPALANRPDYRVTTACEQKTVEQCRLPESVAQQGAQKP